MVANWLALGTMLERVRRILAISIIAVVAVVLVEQAVQCFEERRLLADQQSLTVGDNSVRYALSPAPRPDASPVIVMLNGMAASIEAWRRVTLPLSRDYSILTYDRNGVGLSGLSDVGTADEQAEELRGLLDALDLKGPVMIVSYSFSSSMARVFAQRFPERTAGVFLLDPYLGEADVKRPNKPTPLRNLGRTIGVSLLKSMLGFYRVRNWLFEDPPSSPEERREEFILRRNLHWLAVGREAWEGRERSLRAMESVDLGPIPLFLLCGEGETAFDAIYLATCRDIAQQSTAGEFVLLPSVDHAQLLNDPTGRSVVIDEIRRLAELARPAPTR